MSARLVPSQPYLLAMPIVPLWSIYLAIAAAAFCMYWLARRRPLDCHLPPGPPADPLIGHYRVFPRTYQAAVFFQWSQLYGRYIFPSLPAFVALSDRVHFAGDLFYLEILGRKIVIVNNYDIANELLHKRSANYSDRPVFPLFMK